MKIPIEISARHIHLSQKDLEKLFGKNYKLKVLYKISQPGQFAAKETITLINGNNRIENVRIIGPVRKNSQIEISLTDARTLNIKLPIRISENTLFAPKLIIQNKNKKIKTPAIIAQRHLHVSNEQAKKLNLKNHQIIKIKINGERGLIFNNIVVRAGKGHFLSFQLDTDEANAAGIKGKGIGEIIK
ncbi:MAG: PduL/EutD family phosphate acyltransferase [Nanoarchaeota archaeon]